MKNIEIEDKETGRKYWVSRSVAAVTTVYAKIDGVLCVLANQRGKGVLTNPGKWNCPSGYLDFNETIKGCAVREVFEETGIKLSENDLTLMSIDDRPSRRGKQNILFRYACYIGDKSSEELKNALTTEFAEPNEVDDVAWIPITDIDFVSWPSKKHQDMILDHLAVLPPPPSQPTFWDKLKLFF